MKLRVIIPILPMSLNQLIRASYWAYKKERDDIQDMLLPRLPECATQTHGRVAVRVEVHKSSRSRKRDDPANRPGRAKAVLDVLVRLGVLVDDSDDWLDFLGVDEYRDPSATRSYTVIEVEWL